MDSNAPHDSGYYDAYHYERRGVSTVAILMIGVFAVMSFYIALLAWSPLFTIIAPGNEPNLPFFRELPGVQDTSNDPPVAETIEDRINVLFLGTDRRLDDPPDTPARTDSVMVLTIDQFSKTAGAFSIPRDTLVDIPNGNGGIYTQNRINIAYELGEYTLTDYPGGGPGLAMDTVELNFGIPIDHYIVMDWTAFIDIINELGGVDIDVPEYAYDPAYSTCSFCSEVYPVEFLPGPEHMDGDRALAYARIRHSDDDFHRIERQQLVLTAMARKAMSTETILNNPIGLYNKFKDAVDTDISDVRAGGLGLLMKQVGAENIRTVSMAPATFPCGDPCGAAAILDWNRTKMEELKAQVFSDVRLSEEDASIEVLNGTTTQGLAGTFAAEMRVNGISETRITTDEYADNLLYDTTVIVDASGTNQATIDKLVDWLDLPAARVLSASDPQAAQFLDTTADVVVVLGGDARVGFGGDVTVVATVQAGG